MKITKLIFSCFIFILLVNNLSAETHKVRICRTSNMFSALMFIAEEHKLFQAQGLTPEFETVSNAKICQDSLLAGKADFMTGPEGPFVFLAVNKPPIKIIANIQKSSEVAVFARKDRGIQNFSDLKGKNIGYLPGTVSYFFLARILKKYGLNKTDLKLSTMQPPSMPSALIGGNIDAFAIWEPWGSIASQKLNNNFITLSDKDVYQSQSALFATNEILAADPEIAKKVLLTLRSAVQVINSKSEESIDFLSRKLNFDKAVLSSLWTQYEHYVSSDSSILSLMKEDFELLKKDDLNFKETALPNFEDYADFSLLAGVNVDSPKAQANLQLEEIKISICRIPAMLSLLSVIADKRGFFKKYAIDVDLHEAAHGKICQDELLSGRTDFTLIGDGPFVYLSANQHDLKVIAMTEIGHAVSIIGNRDSGITEDLNSLKGKKIAYLPGTISATFIYDFLKRNNWETSDVKLNALQPAAMVPAIKGKQVDAIAMWEPWATNANLQLADKSVIISGKDFEHRSILLSRADFIKDKPDYVNRLLEAYLDTEKYIHANQQQSINDLAEYLKISPEIVAKIWANHKTEISIPADLLSHFEQVMELLVRYNPEFRDRKLENKTGLIDSRFLNNLSR